MARVNVYLPDDLADAAKSRALPISALAQRAIQEEIERMDTIAVTPNLKDYIDRADTITVDVRLSDFAEAVETDFRGTWILSPDDDVRSGEPGQDAGRCWGVAVTGRGRFAVYTNHVNGDRGHLSDFDTLDEVLQALPADIADQVHVALGRRRVLDI